MKISACMMVRNEAHNMSQVLESLQDVVDEIIVVDTGSTDKTIEIAELYGAKVYHHPWENNFSTHRNQSINYATGDWIIIIDADERLVKTPHYTRSMFHKWLESEIEAPGYTSIAVFINDFQDGQLAMSCNSARMFKAGTIHYVNCIHNQPIFAGACVLNPYFSLSHFGYDLTPAQMRKKFFRTKGLLYKEMRDNPENFDVPFYFCQLYGHHNYHEKSRYWGEKYLAMRDQIPTESFNSTIYFTLIRNYQESGDLEKALDLMREAMKDRPNDPDLASAMSDHGAMVSNNYLMAEGARRYITGYEEMTNNPALKGGQFYFSMSEDVLALNLYRLCVASLEEGMRCWEAIKPKVRQMNSGLRDELKANLNIVGLPHLLQEVPELGGIAHKTVIDIREVEL